MLKWESTERGGCDLRAKRTVRGDMTDYLPGNKDHQSWGCSVLVIQREASSLLCTVRTSSLGADRHYQLLY